MKERRKVRGKVFPSAGSEKEKGKRAYIYRHFPFPSLLAVGIARGSFRFLVDARGDGIGWPAFWPTVAEQVRQAEPWRRT